ncbi:sortase domain-bontaining protein [Streptomyces sp. MMS24-I2-30]|uniref:sortase domain-containing protein n=1 Tax=Streptomyces sp. MMS24-I2-30 TaxID=3351564 RepID=UPI003896D306
MSDRVRTTGTGRLVTGIAWALLLLGLWLWGREAADVPPGVFAPATGDMAAVGRPAGAELPPQAEPLPDAPPQRLEIPGLGVRASVVDGGPDGRDAAGPPSCTQPSGSVAWHGGGTEPGAAGAAVLVGAADTGTGPAVFHRVGAMRPGEQVRVARADGTVAEFTVDDVRVLPRDHFDTGQAYGPRRAGRAELRLVTCDDFDRAGDGYPASVVVSAYLTGTGR